MANIIDLKIIRAIAPVRIVRLIPCPLISQIRQLRISNVENTIPHGVSLARTTNRIEITENFSVNRIAQHATLIPSSKSTLYCHAKYCHAKQTARIPVRNAIQNDSPEHLKTLAF